MQIVVYSDSGYESMVEAFLISRKYANSQDVPVIYYTVGFESTLEFPNLKKITWELNDKRPDLTFYKPEILIDSLKYGDHMLYMDVDIILSRRFDIGKLQNKDLDYPIASSGPQENVWTWEAYGDVVTRYDETKLMKYFGVTEKSCRYLWASMISYNSNCLDFLEEWKSILLNPYLQKRRKEFFPFREETAYNVTLWKRGAKRYFDLVFFNTLAFDSFFEVENNEQGRIEIYKDFHETNTDPSLYQTCKDFGSVLFYHGFKPGEEFDKVLSWIKEKI
jgi:hypothetical protein